MWSDGNHVNEHGEPILLFQPVGGSCKRIYRRRNSKSSSSTTAISSHLGGLPCFHENDTLLLSNFESNAGSTNPRCKMCNEQMYLLIQIHAPLDDLDRTLYLFGCNNFSCHSRESDDDGIEHVESERFNRFYSNKTRGSVRCFRSQQCFRNLTEFSDESMARDNQENGLVDSDWGVNDGCNNGWGENADSEWGGETINSSGDNISLVDLETLLINCELKSPGQTSKSFPSAVVDVQQTKVIVPSFEYHNLETVNEPIVIRKGCVEDDDEVEVECGNVDATKVDEMLSRYLDVEDDENILSALKGGNKCKSTVGGGGERYERLPLEELSLLAFSTRLKRAPGQVARYAYGGVPLWSIPFNEPQSQVSKSSQQSRRICPTLPSIPQCDCGAERVFEFQILPSVLHVLDVDSYVIGRHSKKCDDLLDLISSGGMNWGVIAVYSCPESCDLSREEFVIVQEAVFDIPMKRNTITDDTSDDSAED